MSLRIWQERDVAALNSEREKALSVANTSESLLKAEKVAQEQLAQQLWQTETENLALKKRACFFERLLPSSSTEG